MFTGASNHSSLFYQYYDRLPINEDDNNPPLQYITENSFCPISYGLKSHQRDGKMDNNSRHREEITDGIFFGSRVTRLSRVVSI